MNNGEIVRFTFKVRRGNENAALDVAQTFLDKYPQNHDEGKNSGRHGVGAVRNGVAFFASGHSRNVRVVESDVI